MPDPGKGHVQYYVHSQRYLQCQTYETTRQRFKYAVFTRIILWKAGTQLFPSYDCGSGLVQHVFNIFF